MPSVAAWFLLSLVFTAYIPSQVSSAQCQVAGWFGQSCRYQCHCEDNAVCDGSTGRCPGACHSDWFGPACQYVSSKFTTTGTDSDLTWLTDNDPATCNSEKIHTVTVKLDTPQPITWVRLVVNDPGRNVALKQDAKQPSIYFDWVATKAVDGVIKRDDPSETCSRTNISPKNRRTPWWAVEFHRRMKVTQFKVFSRQDCCEERLVGFRLDAFRRKSDNLFYFSYKDATPKSAPKQEYTITPSSVIDQSLER
ncbi:fucolectin-1, partial [Elysia marginata]